MNYIKKIELLSEGFSHFQIEKMEREETLSEGEELGHAKQLVKQSEIFDKLKNKYAILIYELNTDRDRAKIKDANNMSNIYKEVIFGLRGKKYQYNLRYNKIKQIDGEYNSEKSCWEKEQQMPSNFISDEVKSLFSKFAQASQDNSHKDRIYFDKNGKMKTTNPHQLDTIKYKEKVEKISNPEEKEKKSKAYEKLITNREKARNKELEKNYTYASKYFNY